MRARVGDEISMLREMVGDPGIEPGVSRLEGTRPRQPQNAPDLHPFTVSL